MTNKIFIILLSFVISITTAQEKRIGDPGVTFDQASINANKNNYPQMSIWKTAGVQGGIPYTRTGNNGFNRIVDFTGAKNSDGLNAAINRLANQLGNNQKGLIMLPAGTYTINKPVNMKSGVSLKGKNRNTVVCMVSTTQNAAFSFNRIGRAGLYTMTIRGNFENKSGKKVSKPKYPWNYGINNNFELKGTGNDNTLVWIKDSKNCWLDKVNLINSAKEPLRVAGRNSGNNTLRDLYVDGSFNKAGGAQGYFFLLSGRNLITGCKITHLRHISLQGDFAEFNVLYDNDFKQEVSFHTGDNGNNLIENNYITLPNDMPPIVPSEGFKGELPSDANSNKPDYFPIMGPWSRNPRHTNSKNPNWVFKNKCLQLNHNKGGSLTRPWSDDSKVYTGPKKKGITIQERIDNFPPSPKGVPIGGKLYAVKNVRLIGQGSNGSLGYGEYENTTYNYGNGGGNNGGGDNGNCNLANTETMNRITESGFVNNYTYTGDNGIKWTVNAKLVNNNLDGNTSKKIYIRSGKVGIKSSNIAGGISSFCVKGQNLFFSSGQTKLQLLINDEVVATKTTSNSSSFDFKVNNINIGGNVTIALKNASNQSSTILIDNISWNKNNSRSNTKLISEGFQVIATPNAITSNDLLDVEINSKEEGTIILELFNNIGQRLQQSTYGHQGHGINNVQLDLSNISGITPGILYLRVTKGSERLTKSIVVKN
ncbi:T9SS type A sorting domain-containing protein [Aquimarina aggregata]|uniref:T9SS type A sorting domain-containing protein n=1 Tax=Aquimarina aggregata TaxID=1642818 RepID=UPI0024902DDB|nr:T9SS type A sorting domain-containing protein [Aquimarina aggregata]